MGHERSWRRWAGVPLARRVHANCRFLVSHSWQMLARGRTWANPSKVFANFDHSVPGWRGGSTKTTGDFYPAKLRCVNEGLEWMAMFITGIRLFADTVEKRPSTLRPRF